LLTDLVPLLYAIAYNRGMPIRTERSAIIDEVLKLIAVGSVTATALLAPNALQLFHKPLRLYMGKLDERERRREIQRTLRYIKYNHLVTEQYEHGLKLTPKAMKRLEQREMSQLAIPTAKKWDKKWRLVFFDIPESHKVQRDAFASRIRQLGFKVLQRSVFIHPFPCVNEISKVASFYGVARYVSYVETTHIDNDSVLRQRFRSLPK